MHLLLLLLLLLFVCTLLLLLRLLLALWLFVLLRLLLLLYAAIPRGPPGPLRARPRPAGLFAAAAAGAAEDLLLQGRWLAGPPGASMRCRDTQKSLRSPQQEPPKRKKGLFLL